MKASDCINLLRSNSVFWSKLGFCYDPPRLDENGKPIVFFDDFDRFANHHRNFTDSGVKIHTSILFNGWVGVGKYDYELTDKVLNAVFKDNSDIYYVPRIKLNVPLDWGKKNPEDVFVYHEGPREAGKIKELVGTAKHDYLGYETPDGYYTAGGWKDNRPNVGGLISNQSFSSKKWLSDAGETLRRLIRHLEDGPFGDRILAYHIAYGVSGETCFWGRFGRNGVKFGDYGIANRKAFFQWGLKEYKSLDALRKAWSEKDLTEEKFEPPAPELREQQSGSLDSYMRGRQEDQICIDYDKFNTEVNVNAIEHFGKIAKEETNGKAVGSFYGYLMEVRRSAYTGHLGFDQLLNSPYIDFIAAPKSYYRSGPGDPGGVLAPAQSINRQKLWLDELDNRTHLCKTAEKQCQNLSETQTVMWREFSKNLAHNSGMWWMDLGGGWYDSPEILKEIGKIEKISQKIKATQGKSISEILLVVDDKSFFNWVCGDADHNMFMKEFVREAHLCGAPIDMYRLKDIEDIDLSQYKLICFLNAFKFDVGQWDKIKKRLPEKVSLMWNYAAGILNPKFSLSNIEEITGFKVCERSRNAKPKLIPDSKGAMRKTSIMELLEDINIDVPLLEIIPTQEVNALADYSDGGIALAERSCSSGSKDIYCALPMLKAEHIRIIGELAGVHFYAPANCAIYANSRFISFFPKNDMEFQAHLKKPQNIIDISTGELLEQKEIITLNIKAKGFKFCLFSG